MAVSELSLLLRLKARLAFRPAVRARVWKKLATQISNNMRLDESLRLLQRYAKENRSALGDVYTHILAVLGNGRTLDEALDGLASQEEIMLISSAQSSGRLAEGLNLAVRVLETQVRMRKAVKSSLAAPCATMLACMAMFIVVAQYVVPQLALVSDPRTWSGSSYALYLISSFISSWAGIVAGLLLVAALILILFSLPRWTGSPRRWADRMVPWSIYRLTVGTVWLYTIATRMRAGHQLSQILTGMATSSTPYLRERVVSILRHSGHGEDFGTALKNCGLEFPSKEIVDDMRVYSRMPGFQSNMMEIADTWIEDGLELVKKYANRIAYIADLLVIFQLVLVTLAGTNFQSMLGGM